VAEPRAFEEKKARQLVAGRNGLSGCNNAIYFAMSRHLRASSYIWTK